MSENNYKSISIKVQNREYKIVGNKSESYIQNIVKYLNSKMDEIMKANPSFGLRDVAVLSAINLTDDLFQCSYENEELKEEIKVLKEKKDQEAYKKENKDLKDLINKLQESLIEKDYEIKDLGSKLASMDENSQKQQEKIQDEKLDIKIKQLEADLETMKNNVEIAENLAAEFQNRAYNLELKYTQERDKNKALEEYKEKIEKENTGK